MERRKGLRRVPPKDGRQGRQGKVSHGDAIQVLFSYQMVLLRARILNNHCSGDSVRDIRQRNSTQTKSKLNRRRRRRIRWTRFRFYLPFFSSIPTYLLWLESRFHPELDWDEMWVTSAIIWCRAFGSRSFSPITDDVHDGEEKKTMDTFFACKLRWYPWATHASYVASRRVVTKQKISWTRTVTSSHSSWDARWERPWLTSSRKPILTWVCFCNQDEMRRILRRWQREENVGDGRSEPYGELPFQTDWVVAILKSASAPASVSPFLPCLKMHLDINIHQKFAYKESCPESLLCRFLPIRVFGMFSFLLIFSHIVDLPLHFFFVSTSNNIRKDEAFHPFLPCQRRCRLHGWPK